MIKPSPQIMPLFGAKYPSGFYQEFNLFKHKLLHEDFSEETKLLSEDLIREDKSNYNAWYAKKMYIINQECAMQNERVFVDGCLTGKAKSFQVWEQKRFLAERHQDYESELASIDRVLGEIDNKNYHAWSYRVWLVTQGKFYLKDMQFSTRMIEEDICNNSAWSYRFYLVEKIVESTQDQEARQQFLQKQVTYVMDRIGEKITNAASWNYLRGLFPSIQLKKFSSKNTQHKRVLLNYQDYPQILNLCNVLLEQIEQVGINQNNVLDAREIMSTLVHIHSQSGDQKAIQMCNKLAKADQQRASYWGWVAKNL